MAFTPAITARIWQPWAYDLTWLEGIGGGSIAAGTRSYGIFAVYDTVDTSFDAMGFARSTYSLGQTSTVLNKTNGANAALTFTWTAPRAGLAPPDHYLLAYQVGATWDETANSTIFASVSGSLLTVTVTSIGSLGTLGNHQLATSISLSPAALAPPQRRTMALRGYNGIIAPASYAFTSMLLPGAVSTEVSPYESIALSFPRMAAGASAQANWASLCWWADKGWPVLLVDTTNGSSITEYDYYHGSIAVGTVADHAHEQHGMLPLVMLLEGVHRG